VRVEDLQPGDAVISFSRKDIFVLKRLIETRLQKTDQCAVVYGGLPLEHRAAQAEAFNTRKLSYLIASDAIGLGLNLNIGRVLFASLSKWTPLGGQQLIDGRLVRQIGGRAGRFNSEFAEGQVGVLQLQDHDGTATDLQHKLEKLWKKPAQPYRKAGIMPPDSFLMSAAGTAGRLLGLLEQLEERARTDSDFFVCSTLPLRLNLKALSGAVIDRLDVRDALLLSRAPVRHPHPIGHAILKSMASHLAACRQPSEFTLPNVSSYYSNKTARLKSREERLAGAEEVYRALDVFKWIALRFPHAFNPECELVEKARESCSLFIKNCLET
jgi:ATP-dependent RNA helicase SUPV3L1/SUV3